MKLPFKAKVRDVGGSYVVTVPKVYIDNSLISTEEETDFYAEVSEMPDDIA